MQLKIKKVNLSTGGPIVAILNKEDTKKLDLFALDRIKIKVGKREIHALIDVAKGKNSIKPGQIGFFEETFKILGKNKKGIAKISPSQAPKSIDAIKKKLDGKELTKKEINYIIKDLMSNSLSDIEVTYFVSACYNNGLSNEEVTELTKATIKEGKKVKLGNKIIADKHCIGGVPNNRTSMLITPIVAAAGLTIPKTSSRAITSPSGTADTMETLAKINFSVPKLKSILKKTKGCLIWHGSLDGAGADTRLIKVRYPLRLDPQGLLLASVLAKKMAVGATHLLVDLPIGKKAKLSTKKEARNLKSKFQKITKKLGIKTKVIITNGSQPIGNGIGPNLEARDILYILRRDPKAPKDLEKKAIMMSDKIFKLTKTKASAKEILNSGLAYKKMKEIIRAQGGNPRINPDKIPVGEFQYQYKASKKGKIIEIDNIIISKIARLAGASQNKGAGIYINKKLKDKVKKGEKIFTIYAENKNKLEFAKQEVKQAIKIK
jgi:putative thymidine phosphorylase